MIDFAAHRQKIREVKEQLSVEKSYYRRRDLKKHLGRLYKEMSEAKKWQRGKIDGRTVEL